MKIVIVAISVVFIIALLLLVYDSGIPMRCPRCGSPMRKTIDEDGETYECEDCGYRIIIKD